jgi:hypothetical protein
MADNILLNSPKEVHILAKTDKVWRFPQIQANGRVLLEFEHRIDHPQLAGWCPAWQLFINGRIVSGMATRSHTRLLNKKPVLAHKDHKRFRAWTGDKWYSLYSPDFEKGKSRFKPDNPEAYRVVLEISDLLNKNSENQISIRFVAHLENFYRRNNIKRSPALAVRNLRVSQQSVPTELGKTLRQEKKLVEMKDIPLPAYSLVPDTSVASPVNTLLTGSRPLEIRFSDWSVPVFSHFSVPGSQNEASLGSGNFLKTNFYTVSRTIKKSPARITFFDKLENTSSELIGIRIRYSVPSNQFKTIYLAGDASPARKRASGGANPSIFATHPKRELGLGMIAEDDIFRVQNIQFDENGKAGIMTETFALSPGESRTIEWSIYPTCSADYFDFINAVRRDWEVNFPIVGQFLTGLSLFYQITEAKARRLVKKTDLNYCTLSVLYWRHLGGKFSRYTSYIHGAALMDEKCRAIQGPGQAPSEVDVEPMRKFIRKTLANAHKFTPNLKTMIYVHNQLSVELDDEEKYKGSAIIQRDGSPRRSGIFHYFIPTAENAYGRKQLAWIAYLLDNFDLDGIYHDEFTSVNRPITYGMWDRVSVELDKNNRVSRKIGFIPLLMLAHNLKVMDYVINQRKKVFIANFAPATRSERRFKYPRFEETFHSYMPLLTHLYTPIQLGDILTFPKNRQGMMTDVRNALLNGTLYYYYHRLQACPTITNLMFPFTPIEIHRGWLLGQERILTIYSGRFGWKRENSLCVPHVFSQSGEKSSNYSFEFKNSTFGTVCDLTLPKDYCAALIRIPVKAILSDGAALSDISWKDGVFQAKLSGNGIAKISYNGKTTQWTATKKGTLVIIKK